ncbi:hypothetical protein CVM50_20930 [Pseudooceanicola marinus]|nr:hypothetical protein CVM50_20930 [Pseudooceanicola marinus]
MDSRILKEKWLETDTSRLLANRSGTATLGSMLVHSTLGWHSPSQVNERYAKLFQFQPFETSEIETLDKLWVLRHSVAHNAGMIIHYDATRIGNEGLAEHAADIDAEFISQTFDFLSSLAKKICEEGGDKLLRMYFTPLVARGANYQTDKTIYQNLWYLSAYLESRAQDLPVLKAEDYASDFEEYSAPVG